MPFLIIIAFKNYRYDKGIFGSDWVGFKNFEFFFESDVFARITDDEYSDFYDTVCDAAKIAREAFECEELSDSVCKWRKIFGNEFPSAPEPSKNNSSAGFTHRTEKSSAVPEGRFA